MIHHPTYDVQRAHCWHVSWCVPKAALPAYRTLLDAETVAAMARSPFHWHLAQNLKEVAGSSKKTIIF